MRVKHRGRKIKKSIWVAVLLSLAVFVSTIPTTTAQEKTYPDPVCTINQSLTETDVYEEARAQAELELMVVYNESGGSREAVMAHAEAMMQEATAEAILEANETETELIEFLGGGGEGTIFAEESGEAGDTQWQRRQMCMQSRYEECRQNLIADIYLAAAAAFAVAAGCTAVTGGTAFIVCVAAATAVHVAGVMSARHRYRGCIARARYDCTYF